MRSFEAIVYGRRLYELMNAYWPTAESDPAATGPMVEFARIWNSKQKVVVSSSMQEAPAGWRLTSGDPETILEELRRDFSGDLGRAIAERLGRGIVITNAATRGDCQNADPRCRRTAVGSVSSVKVRVWRTTEPMEESE